MVGDRSLLVALLVVLVVLLVTGAAVGSRCSLIALAGVAFVGGAAIFASYRANMAPRPGLGDEPVTDGRTTGGFEAFFLDEKRTPSKPEGKKIKQRIWHLKNELRKNTTVADSKTRPAPHSALPDGVCSHSIFTPEECKTVYKDLEDLFKRGEKLGIPFEKGGGGPLFAFGRASFPNVIETLHADFPRLTDHLIATFERFAASIGHEDPLGLAFKHVRCALLRYPPGKGIELHVDNVMRSNGGPILTVTVGPPKVLFDLIPLEEPGRESIRIEIENGEGITMDGESRYTWAHAIPHGQDYGGKPKYTILFLCNQFPDAVVTGKSGLTGAAIVNNLEDCKVRPHVE